MTDFYRAGVEQALVDTDILTPLSEKTAADIAAAHVWHASGFVKHADKAGLLKRLLTWAGEHPRAAGAVTGAGLGGLTGGIAGGDLGSALAGAAVGSGLGAATGYGYTRLPALMPGPWDHIRRRALLAGKGPRRYRKPSRKTT